MIKYLAYAFRAGTSSAFIGLATSATLLVASNAFALPFDSNVAITATVNLDNNSVAAPAGLTQSGTFSSVIGGVSTSATVNSALTVSGTLPKGGALTDIGDGVGMSFTGSGSGSFANVQSADLLGNYAVTLQNNSATDTFVVTLGWIFTNQVDANGTDAGIEGELSLLQGATEFFFSDLISDTFLGDSAGGSNDGTDVDTPFGTLGSFGAALLDDGTLSFSFSLTPGQTVNLSGRNDMLADLFNGSYSATVSSRLFVSSVVNQTTPPPPPGSVPEPASLWLFGAGLMGFRAARRVRPPR